LQCTVAELCSLIFCLRVIWPLTSAPRPLHIGKVGYVALLSFFLDFLWVFDAPKERSRELVTHLKLSPVSSLGRKNMRTVFRCVSCPCFGRYTGIHIWCYAWIQDIFPPHWHLFFRPSLSMFQTRSKCQLFQYVSFFPFSNLWLFWSLQPPVSLLCHPDSNFTISRHALTLEFTLNRSETSKYIKNFGIMPIPPLV